MVGPHVGTSFGKGIGVSLTDDTKDCPDCAETVKSAAKVCRFCGHKFKEPSVLEKATREFVAAAEKEAITNPKSSEQKRNENIGCGIVLLVVFSLLVWTCSSGDSETIDTANSEKAVNEAEKRRKGFHCLSEWDGSNRSTVKQVERLLRNPESFEHVETKIAPVDEETGEHGLAMTYRAENGFGGTNVETIYARVNNGSCEAQILGKGSGVN